MLASLGEPGALDALWLSLRTTRGRAGDHRARGHARRYLLATRPLPRPRAGRSRWSSCRSCCRPRSPASRCWRRSARAACSAAARDAASSSSSTAARGRRADVRLRAVLPAPGAGRRSARSTATLARRLAHARRSGGAHVRADRDPDAAPGLVAGAALAWGRALGEFGATLMFAGSFRGITQTVPLAIYERFSTDFAGALRSRRCSSPSPSPLLLTAKLVGGWAAAVLRVEAHAARRLRARRRARGRRRASASRSPARRAPGKTQRAARRRRPRAAARTAGHVRRGGVARHREAASTCAPDERRCGYVFQDYALFPHLSAWQNVAYGLRGKRRAERPRAIALLERFGVAHRADARPRTLSGGERQRVARRPRARASSPRRCCSTSRCRRSTHAPAPPAARELAAVLRDAGVPALLVTHDFTEAALLGDRVGVIDARPHRPARHAPASSPPRPPRRSSPTSPAPSCSPAPPRRAPTGSPASRSTAAAASSAPSPATGPVAVSALPVGDRARAAGQRRPGSARRTTSTSRSCPSPRSATASAIGLAAPQPLTAELSDAGSAHNADLSPGSSRSRPGRPRPRACCRSPQEEP